MKKYIDAEKLKAEIEKLLGDPERVEDWRYRIKMEENNELLKRTINIITSLQQEQPDEQPEYGYLSTEYVNGKKSIWSVGDVLAYYICTSNEEGEYLLGKIVNVEFNEEDGWIYTFEDKSILDEQSLVEDGAYKKN